MNRLSPDWRKGVVVGRYGPALHADVVGEGLQRGKVLIDEVVMFATSFRCGQFGFHRPGGLPERVMIDLSHDNSGKDPERQPAVADAISAKIAGGECAIVGVTHAPTSTPPSWGRRALSPATRNAPSAREASCCSTPEPLRCPRAPAC